MNITLNLYYKSPTHSTILLWTKKYGLYRLKEEREKSNNWAIILDESVQFGQEKLLVIYGVNLENIDFCHCLNFANLTPFTIKSARSWNAESIKSEIELISGKIGKIKYAVADQGNSIKKALQLSGIVHIHDITHKISLIVEHKYKKDERFIDFTQKMAKMRGKLCLSKVAHILPPIQRSKARFLNLTPITEWAMSVLKILKENKPENYLEIMSLQWLGEFKELILELNELITLVNKIQTIFKTNGISKRAIDQYNKINKEIYTDNTKEFSKNFEEYISQTIKMLPKETQLLCSSDIIESAFGKYKNYLSLNPMLGITNLSLCLSAFTLEPDNCDLEKILNTIKVDDITQWTKQNMQTSVLKKRKAVLKIKSGKEKFFLN